jgi:hypothetical protein
MLIDLHIGRAHTGAPEFAAGCAAARPALRAAGIAYPSSPAGEPQHMQLFWSAAAQAGYLDQLHPWHARNWDGMPLDARLAALGVEGRGADRMVLSCEWFSLALPYGAFAGLVEGLGSLGEVRVWAMLRDQGDVMVEAWTAQIVQGIALGPLSGMTGQIADRGRAEGPLSHLALADGWAPLAPLHLVPWAPGPAQALASAMGLPAGIGFPPEPALPPLALLPHLQAASTAGMGREAWEALVATATLTPELLAAQADPEIDAVAQALRAEVRAAYAWSNDRLAEVHGAALLPPAAG